MGISLFLDFVLFLGITFLFKKKQHHTYVYLFVFLFMVFIFSSYISVIVDNLELWKVKKKPIPYATYRVAELLLFPLLVLWFLEFYYIKRSLLYRFFVYIIFLVIPVLIERWLIKIKIIEYKNWESYYSIIAWFCFLLLGLLLHKIMKKILIKEGVSNEGSSIS